VRFFRAPLAISDLVAEANEGRMPVSISSRTAAIA
jgi:hypothetical protein